MNEILIEVRFIEQPSYQKIWLDPDYIISDFIQDLNEAENRIRRINEVYLCEEERFLNPKQTFYENQVCFMDHLIVI